MPRLSIITPVRLRHEEEATWLSECILSVRSQTEQDCEHILINDHSRTDLDVVGVVKKAAAGDLRVKLFNLTEASGCSAARNAAAKLARADFILPLDADDRLDAQAATRMLDTWAGKGFIYPSVMLFGGGEADVRVAPEPYDFDRLLVAAFLLVGNMHLRRDWERLGGWKPELANAFEDWEYWINAGRNGICGTPCADALYWYRRNPHGRIAMTRATPTLGIDASSLIRRIHADLYGGFRPMSCCGRRSADPVPASPQGASAMGMRVADLPGAQSGLVLLRYLLSDVGLTPWYGPVTQIQYVFSAERNLGYVDARDVEGMLRFYENRHAVFALEPVQALPAVDTAPVDLGASTATIAPVEAVTLSVPVEPEADVKPKRRKKGT